MCARAAYRTTVWASRRIGYACSLACVHICLLACFRARVLACLPARSPANVVACILACFLACLLAYLLARLLVGLLARLLACLLACWLACPPTGLLACVSACLPTYLRACLLASCNSCPWCGIVCVALFIYCYKTPGSYFVNKVVPYSQHARCAHTRCADEPHIGPQCGFHGE